MLADSRNSALFRAIPAAGELGRRAQAITASGVCVLILLVSTILTTASAAEPLRGMALVIGNDQYEHLPELANPGNDARAIEVLLADLGFETELSLDRSIRRLRRDIDNFTDDADGADVVLVYYAGHGIEAGGENWLVPVDADLTAPANAGRSMVALSSIVDRLRKSASVVIVLLDACRDNPFPAGTSLSSDGVTVPAPMSVSGLGETRGVRVLANNDAQDDNLGTVIGFSAAPGQASLDGDGDNSPYAHAILKHMMTLAGEEFGTVMRMVAEEVYLDTSGRQRPWINENLRRLLFFGEPATVEATEEAEIASERRRLLLTISTLDQRRRKAMENIASTDGIPLDAVFAMLKALGADAPSDSAELEQVMRRQTERVKTILDERNTLSTANPEIRRLGELADRAIDEGAFKAATHYLDRAKKLMEDNEVALSKAEADIEARRLENAAIYARSADAHVLAFDNLAAARDYGRAFEQAKRWDAALAWEYKSSEASALVLHGIRKGDLVALKDALQATETAHSVIAGGAMPLLATKSRINRAIHLSTLGRMTGDVGMLEEAAEILQPFLSKQVAGFDSSELITFQITLANAYRYLGAARNDREAFQRAISLFEKAAVSIDRGAEPVDWARTTYNLGAARAEYGDRFNDISEIWKAVADYELVLAIYTPQAYREDWIRSTVNLGMAYATIGDNQQDQAMLKQAEATLKGILDSIDRDAIPIVWARAHKSLGRTYTELGRLDGDPEQSRSAVQFTRLALEEFTRENTPQDWAATQSQLGSALLNLAGKENPGPFYSQAVEALRKSLGATSREFAPDKWATRQRNIGIALYLSGAHRRDANQFLQALAAFENALLVRTSSDDPADWASVMVDLGIARAELGQLVGDSSQIEAAVDELRGGLAVLQAGRDRSQQYRGQSFLAKALSSQFVESGDHAKLEESVAAYQAAVAVGEEVTSAKEWLETNVFLGKGLMLLGQKGGDYNYFEQAIPVFQEAIKTGAGLDDAENNFTANRGLALANYFIGKKENDPDHLQAAIDAFETAFKFRRRTEGPLLWAKTKRLLGESYVALGYHQADPRTPRGAIAAYEDALQVYTRDTSPNDWRKVKSGLGIALQQLGERTNDPATLNRSAQSFRSALDILDCSEVPAECAPVTHNLAVALKGRGERIGDISVLEEALSASQQSWLQYQQAGFSQYKDYFDKQAEAINIRIQGLQ